MTASPDMVPKRRPRWRRRLLAVASVPAALFLAFLLLDRLFPLQLPGDDAFAVVVTAKDGTPLRSFADKNGVWRYPVSIQDVSPRYIQALLNYEDRWFWDHPGVNPLALARAVGQWLWFGHPVSGGSTLTMQVARILEPNRRSIPGKLVQAFHALQLEWHLSKRQILTLYLNHAPFGGPLEGVQAASYAYLGKSAKHLSHAEAALLAVLPQSPSALRPDRRPRAAQQARNKVLNRLRSFGVWSAHTVQQAKAETVAAWPLERPMLAPLLARRLYDEAQPGKPLRTTIDAGLQSQLGALVHDYTTRLPPHSSAAALIVDNRTLAVRAYVGSPELTNDNRYGYVDMVQAVRSPGSTLKPFLYGFAIEDGLIHSASLLLDAPQSFDGYRPGDFSGGFAGPVTATAALQRSLNVPAVDLLDRLGPDYFAARLRQGRPQARLPRRSRTQPRHDPRRRRHQTRNPGRRLHRPGPQWKIRRPALHPEFPSAQSPHAATRRRLDRPPHARHRPTLRRRPNRPRRNPRRLENRHQLRLPRRLGRRRHQPLHHRHLGRPPRRHPHPRPLRRHHRRPTDVQRLRPAAGRPQRHYPSRPRASAKPPFAGPWGSGLGRTDAIARRSIRHGCIRGWRRPHFQIGMMTSGWGIR